MHIKRQKTRKEWPIPRKGTKYVARPLHNLESIPLVIILRDILKLAKTTKEAKFILNKGNVLINGKVRKERKYPLMLFDVLTLKDEKKNLRLEISGKKLVLKEISEKEANSKICKVIGKKVLKKGKIQINLDDGRNMIAKEKIEINDSIKVNFKGEIEKIIKIEKNAKVEIIGGRHAGENGVVEAVEGNEAYVKLKDGKRKIKLKNIMAI